MNHVVKLNPTPSPETLELARQAVERNEATKKALDAMSPENREKHLKAWSKGLAEQSVAIGERGVGCACCDPDVKAKIKQEEPKVPTNLRRTSVPMVTLTCKCKTVLFQGKELPSYSAITCPKCKLTSKVRRPEPAKPAAKPAEQLAPADASKQAPPYVAKADDPMRLKA